jgi:ankyrin repeat protein
LHYAVEHGHASIVDWLLALGADPKATLEPAHDTPLHLAARSACLRCVRALLDAGAAIDARNAFGQQPIHYAAQQPDSFAGAAARMLLARRADPNARDDRGFTPAHFAALANNVAVLELLVDAGSSLDAETPRRVRPIDSAAWARADVAYRWLQRKGHASNTYAAPDPLEDAVRRNDEVALEWLLRFEDAESFPPAERERLRELARTLKKDKSERVVSTFLGRKKGVD